MKPLVVVNPSAGGGRAGRVFGEMKPVIERALGEVDVRFTTQKGHAIALAREASGVGRELIVAVGGDGTLNEVANGILEVSPETTALGFIGQGTGGDFRRSLGLEHRLDRYLSAIAAGTERRVDAARATFSGDDGQEQSRWFINVLSAGMGGLVDKYVAEGKRTFGSTLTYAMASLRALSEIEPAPIRCTFHRGGEREQRVLPAYVLAVCNGSSFGSGMQIAPMARLDDGRLDVVVMTAPSKLAFVGFASKMYRGAHLGEPGVTTLACDAVDLEIDAGRPGLRVLLDIDGEPLGALPVRIAITRGALRFRA